MLPRSSIHENACSLGVGKLLLSIILREYFIEPSYPSLLPLPPSLLTLSERPSVGLAVVKNARMER